MPPLRSTPCSCTRPARTSGARPNASDQNTDPFPDPDDPATNVCGPIGSRHSAPSDRRPIDHELDLRETLGRNRGLERHRQAITERQRDADPAGPFRLHPDLGRIRTPYGSPPPARSKSAHVCPIDRVASSPRPSATWTRSGDAGPRSRPSSHACTDLRPQPTHPATVPADPRTGPATTLANEIGRSRRPHPQRHSHETTSGTPARGTDAPEPARAAEATTTWPG